MSSEELRQSALDMDAAVALHLREALSERLTADELDKVENIIQHRRQLAVEIYRWDRYLNDGKELRNS